MTRRSHPRATRGPRNPAPSLAPFPGTLDGVSADEAARIVERACGSKERYSGPGAARRAARRIRGRTGRDVQPYRCPFSGGMRAAAHWHIGHVPSIASLGRIAAAIRIRAQGIGADRCVECH